ncbi:MAG: hypothetical protein WC905_00200 [Patescibacteria group bacterium]|jgi:hypothetical protein
MKKKLIITAAGGNATALEIINLPLSRLRYQNAGDEMLTQFQAFSVEQSGFIISSENRLEMSGGEFCGNASRAAALIFSELNGKREINFRVSGFNGLVKGSVDKMGGNKFNVSCLFPRFSIKISNVIVGGENAKLVDLGGIAHVILEGNLPENYKIRHREIVNELELNNRDAVGVIWARRSPLNAIIDPIVWVKAVDTFFYESSCGSGSIAAAKTFGCPEIIQPTGQPIFVNFFPNQDCQLTSEMEVINEID